MHSNGGWRGLWVARGRWKSLSFGGRAPTRSCLVEEGIAFLEFVDDAASAFEEVEAEVPGAFTRGGFGGWIHGEDHASRDGREDEDGGAVPGGVGVGDLEMGAGDGQALHPLLADFSGEGDGGVFAASGRVFAAPAHVDVRVVAFVSSVALAQK